jgi:hypothetical protein
MWNNANIDKEHREQFSENILIASNSLSCHTPVGRTKVNNNAKTRIITKLMNENEKQQSGRTQNRYTRQGEKTKGMDISTARNVRTKTNDTNGRERETGYNFKHTLTI